MRRFGACRADGASRSAGSNSRKSGPPVCALMFQEPVLGEPTPLSQTASRSTGYGSQARLGRPCRSPIRSRRVDRCPPLTSARSGSQSPATRLSGQRHLHHAQPGEAGLASGLSIFSSGCTGDSQSLKSQAPNPELTCSGSDRHGHRVVQSRCRRQHLLATYGSGS